MHSGEEIQKALTRFSKKWAKFEGSEKAEAQTFLNQLFECYGSDRSEAGAKFEDFKSSAGFMDLHWPGVCIVEMKAPHVSVSSARDQVKRYWEESADEEKDIPTARWVILCNFKEFEIWDPGRFPKSPRATFSLEALPSRYEALMFLAGSKQVPSFLEHHKTLTTQAADTISAVYQSLVDRSAAPTDEITRFTMQSIWTMFAEDLGLLEGSPFQKTVNQLRKIPEDSAAKLGFLFRVLNQKGNQHRKGILAGTRYVNGQLFADPAEVGLAASELDSLAEAAEYDWSKVEPTIFGSLMERIIAGKLGAHYTHEADIMKIVGPTIVRPWQERIDAATTPNEALKVLEELCTVRILDPACGCGNFLYVAYREMRHLEYRIKQRISELAASTGLSLPSEPWPYVPLTNFYGIDIQPAAVLIARVTLWMGHRQMIDLYGEAETPLPLVSLAGITVDDAVFSQWPESDCIIGNPPFLGDRIIRRQHGGNYIDKLKKKFPGIGVVDYSAYWFRRAHAHLQDGQRAGLVSTNTLRENKHRLASLRHIVDNGGVITDAVSSQKWPGEAQVHVSITNWVKKPSTPITAFTLDGAVVDKINSKLKPGPTLPEPLILRANKDKAFIGCQPTGDGFIIDEMTAARLIAEGEKDVIRRYLTSDDLTDAVQSAPSRWIIDFGTMPLEMAMKYSEAMKIVRDSVKPHRENKERHLARLWWQFAWPRPDMRTAIKSKDRYIVSTLTGKRLFFSWADQDWCPSNLVGVFALEDDYSMGVLTSKVFEAWAWEESSTFETRIRFTPSTAFETFPWPAPSPDEKEAVAEASRTLIMRRHEIVGDEQIGLTTLYNRVDEGAYVDLKKLHQDLDEAVIACYHWPKSIAQDQSEILKKLGYLNQQIGQGAGNYAPF
ncbi:DNA methyltransferase [Saccharomonospora iraqiensis]|uniref:DNA methyltransferase n=1 Tax=Saccharomonospora iraqiensis TaxID=52698 RepID=UPI00022E071C|nr:DNA methyltransferase [Saccharomonospora iraqiensis]